MDLQTAEDREFAMLSKKQINTLNAVERMGATLSLFGIIMIFITFAFFKRLRTIPNTFIFFASIANVGACVACLIGYDGILSLHEDGDSPLCQAQGFIFEWFMQSDPWWSFAMAINVYMVFFMSFNPATFRHYLWAYCLVCYGLPAIPAFVFLFIHLENVPVYGDAVLWCWIGSKWNSLRIYSYYLPIWICSVLSAVIYFAVGYHVFHQRNQLRNLSLSTQGKDLTDHSTDVRDSAEKNLTSPAGPQYYGSVTTEIQVTSAAIPTSPMPAYTNPFDTSPKTTFTTNNSSSARRPSEPAPPHHRAGPSSSSEPPPPHTPAAPNAPGVLSPIHTHNYPWSREPSGFGPDSTSTPTDSPAPSTAFTSPFAAPPPPPRSTTSATFEATSHSFNATQYTSISAGGSSSNNNNHASGPRQQADDRGPSPTRLLTSLSARRTPTSDSELPPHAHCSKRGSDETATTSNGAANMGTNIGRQGPPPQQQQPGGGGGSRNNSNSSSFFRRMSGGTRRFGARLKNMDPVKLAYLRTSFVFAISILVTWTPSSINRVYTLIYPAQASYGLNMAAAVVLPLQGVWNAVIYFTTSWRIFRDEVAATALGRRVSTFLSMHLHLHLTRGSGSGSGSGSSSSRRRGRRRPVEVTPPRQSGGSFALGSSPRSEMGRNRRLEGESRDGDGVEGVELQTPVCSPRQTQTPQMARRSTIRVTQKQLDDFA